MWLFPIFARFPFVSVIFYAWFSYLVTSNPTSDVVLPKFRPPWWRHATNSIRSPGPEMRIANLPPKFLCARARLIFCPSLSSLNFYGFTNEPKFRQNFQFCIRYQNGLEKKFFQSCHSGLQSPASFQIVYHMCFSFRRFWMPGLWNGSESCQAWKSRGVTPCGFEREIKLWSCFPNDVRFAKEVSFRRGEVYLVFESGNKAARSVKNRRGNGRRRGKGRDYFAALLRPQPS